MLKPTLEEKGKGIKLTMSLEDAEDLFNTATRYELRDHAFGDTEVIWVKSGVTVGTGYFGAESTVLIELGSVTFKGSDAYRLRKCGRDVVVDRNDESGPESYTEGAIMPALTLEGVLKELTSEEGV